jgi:kynurenine formamidase
MGLADRTPPSESDYEAYRKRFCNWGRWGSDDELGTLNLVTAEVRKAAAGLVKQGRVVSMSRPIDTKAGPANPYPSHHFVAMPSSGGMLDYIGMFIHGFTQTHIDALCHVSTADGQAWNGKPVKGGLPLEQSGTIDFLREGTATRGVLYDVPRLRGSAFVAPGRPVQGWELADAAAAQGVEPRPGDAVVIRSGFGPYWESEGRPAGFASIAGVHASCIEFLYETEASMLVWDMQDAPIADQGLANPAPYGAMPISMHVHQVVLAYMGMPIVDNADLEPLAAACAEAERWEFQLVVAPLNIPGGTGSPVNPLAVL